MNILLLCYTFLIIIIITQRQDEIKDK